MCSSGGSRNWWKGDATGGVEPHIGSLGAVPPAEVQPPLGGLGGAKPPEVEA